LAGLQTGQCGIGRAKGVRNAEGITESLINTDMTNQAAQCACKQQSALGTPGALEQINTTTPHIKQNRKLRRSYRCTPKKTT